MPAQERFLVEDTTLFDGKYTVLSKLREGGMGTIYKVHHNLLDEIRVIKFMRAAVTGDPDLHRRFLQEAKLVTRFKHPNIAAVYDFAIDDDDTAYIVMEYIDGLNLYDVVQALHPLSVPFVLEVAAQTLAALGYMHRKNVVHRDISPDNVMVVLEDGNLVVKLIDLGIAKALDATDGVTKTGYFLGKLKYGSPEQLGALDVDERMDGRSDLYSLGVVLYELLTGRLPFSSTSAQSLIAGHLVEMPAPFSVSDSEGRVPEAVRALVLKALAKKRDERFASAEEMRAAILDLRRTLPDEPLAADAQRLRELHAQEQERAAEQPATPGAQQRMDRNFSPGGGSSGKRTVGVPRQKTQPEWQEPPGDPTRISQPGVDRTVAVTPPRKLGAWPLAGAAAIALVALTAVLLVRRTDSAATRPPAATSSNTTTQAASVVPPTGSLATATVPETLTGTTAVTTAPTETAPELLVSQEAPAQDDSRVAAGAARTRSMTARANALAANGSTQPQFRSGSAALQEGDALVANGSFGPATTRFAEASRLFAAAEAVARRQAREQLSAERRETERVVVPARVEPPPAAESVPERRDPPPAVPPVTERAAEQPVERPAERPAASPESAVRSAVAEFAAAQEALDADRYVGVFPSADRERIAAAFRSFRSQELTLTIENIDVSGDRATVRAREARVAVPRVGSVQRLNAARLIRLERTGGRWVVTSIQ